LCCPIADKITSFTKSYNSGLPIDCRTIFCIKILLRYWLRMCSVSFDPECCAYRVSNQSKKQYYVRLNRLIDVGLIEKQQRIYKLISFDSIVYENHLKDGQRDTELLANQKYRYLE
jgi:hypothetical protein